MPPLADNLLQTRWFIGLLIAMVLIMPLGTDIYLPSLDAMSHDFGRSLADVQATITLFVFSVGLGQLLCGPLSDRIGRRPVAIFGSVTFGLGSVLGLLAPTLEVFYLARILQGIGACAATVAANSAVRDRFSAATSARLYSYMTGALYVVPASAPLIGGALAARFGWRSTLLCMALYALAVTVLFVWRWPETQSRANRQAVRAASSWRGDFGPMLKNRRFLFCALVALSGMAMNLIYVSCAPSVIMTQLHSSSVQFSLWFALNAVISIIGFMLAPKIIQRYGLFVALRLGVTLIVLAGVLALLLPLGFAPSGLRFMAPVLVLSIGFSAALGSAMGLALEPFGARAGAAAALFSILQLSGGSVLATPLLKSGLSPELQLAFVGLVVLLPALLLAPRLLAVHRDQAPAAHRSLRDSRPSTD
ncbi:multidrug effflux MFS transporter [Pseudomonas sp. dw_358]|uniref:multidrug effflux MFS transporter n=1 Tax=Pseudomonas sp. dw_358 TaxID=2720083 RepID=UPI001BD45457|nr:multidrug effflux MFS transporter [Pseudomonas sp. dw_358]